MRRPSRHPLPLVALAAALLLAPPLEAQRTVNERAAVPADVPIRFSMTAGTLRVIGWEHDSIAVTGTLPAGVHFAFSVWAEPAGARGVKGYAEAKQAELAAKGRLELRVPRRARVWVKTHAASVEAQEVAGTLDLSTVTAPITVRGGAAPTSISAESMEGDVTIETGGAAFVRAKSADGDVIVRGGGDDVGVSSVSGRLLVERGRYALLSMQSVTGEVRFAGECANEAALTLGSTSGATRLVLRRDQPASYELVTVRDGRIVNRMTKHLPQPREGGGSRLAFTVGKGGARVAVRSVRGDIVIEPKG